MPRMKKTPEVSNELASELWPEQQWRGGSIADEIPHQLPRSEPIVNVNENDNTIRYTRTTKGKDAIVYDGYIYILNKRTASGRSYWICRNRETCSARLNLDSEGNIIKSTGHYHLPCPEEILRLDFFSEMTRQIQDCPETPIDQIYTFIRERFEILHPYETDFPRLNDMKKSLQLSREPQNTSEREGEEGQLGEGTEDDMVDELGDELGDELEDDDDEEEADDEEDEEKEQQEKVSAESVRNEEQEVVKEGESELRAEICGEISEAIEDIYNFT